MNNIKTFVKILQNVTQHECFNIQIEIKHTISILKKKYNSHSTYMGIIPLG